MKKSLLAAKSFRVPLYLFPLYVHDRYGQLMT